MFWHVYIVRCSDGLLYTGITNDLARRIKEHNTGKGCKFTRCRAPVKLEHIEKAENRPSALKREAEIKRLPRKEKLKLFR